MTQARFTRELHGGESGLDVSGVGRALARAGFLDGLTKFMGKAPAVRMKYGAGKQRGVNRARVKIGLKQTGVYDRRVHEYLERLDAFDAYAQHLMATYAPPPTLCFPLAGEAGSVCQGLHETTGLGGSWAIDFCAPPGTGIVAAERATVTRFSGDDPAWDVNDPAGVFGYTTYLTTPKGYVYFITHQGRRLSSLRVGMHVQAGDLIGYVGNQHYRPDHAHYSVSSPLGPSDAKKRITAVSKAPRVS